MSSKIMLVPMNCCDALLQLVVMLNAACFVFTESCSLRITSRVGLVQIGSYQNVPQTCTGELGTCHAVGDMIVVSNFQTASV